MAVDREAVEVATAKLRQLRTKLEWIRHIVRPGCRLYHVDTGQVWLVTERNPADGVTVCRDAHAPELRLFWEDLITGCWIPLNDNRAPFRDWDAVIDLHKRMNKL